MIAFEDPNNAYRSLDPANVAIDSGKTAFKIGGVASNAK